MSLALGRAGKLAGAFAVLAVLAVGCGKEPKIDPNRISIAVIPKGTTHEFWKSIHAGALKAAKEMDVDIVWKGPLKEDDREAQIAVVENMVRLGVKGIVLAPLDDTALASPVAAAVKAGVPVVIIDSGLKSKAYTSYVATDNLKGGKLGGERLAKLLKKKGRVVMLRYEEGSASTMLREKGFLAVMKKYPRIRVVSANQYGGATTESAYKASENLLAPHKKDGGLDIDGIFCPNESTTFGMLRALQDAGLAGKVTFVGFDASAKLVQALRKGQIQGLVLQNPVNMGYLGVKTMVTNLKNKELPRSRRRPVRKIIDTGEMMATPENMDDPAVKEILEPNLKEWLK
jgi:ribose transport system substrate-binding protein